MSKHRSEKTRMIIAECKPTTLAKLDGRTREARLMQNVRNELTAHVGGRPSATQRALIERCVNLSVRIAIMDAKFAETSTQSEHDSRTYLAWSNTLTRTMRELGVHAASKRTETLQDYLKTPQAAA